MEIDEHRNCVINRLFFEQRRDLIDVLHYLAQKLLDFNIHTLFFTKFAFVTCLWSYANIHLFAFLCYKIWNFGPIRHFINVYSNYAIVLFDYIFLFVCNRAISVRQCPTFIQWRTFLLFIMNWMCSLLTTWASHDILKAIEILNDIFTKCN